MLVLALFLIIFTNSIHLSHEEYLDLVTIIDEFGITNPIVISSQMPNNVILAKMLFLGSHRIRIVKHYENLDDSNQGLLISMTKASELMLDQLRNITRTQTSITILSLNEDTFPFVYDQLEVDIGQEVYFFKQSSKEMFESYIINDMIIKRKLGRISKDKFIWEPDINPNILLRRSNFQGITLKAMTEFSGVLMNAFSNYTQFAPYFPNNETYLINGYAYGLFHDILKVLETRLNFTTNIYKRKVTAWGYVYPQDDGSYTGSITFQKCLHDNQSTNIAFQNVSCRNRSCWRCLFQKG